MVTLLVTELVVTPRLAVVAVTELLLPTGVLFRLALGAMIRLVIPAASDGLISVTLRGVPGFELISTRRGGLLSTTLDWGRDRGTVLSSLSV